MTTGQRKYSVPRRYRRDEPEESIELLVEYDIAGKEIITHQVQDHHQFWRVTCTCHEYQTPKPGTAPMCQHLTHFLSNGKDVQHGRMLDPFVRVVACRKPGIEAHLSLGDPDSAGFRTVWIMRPGEDSNPPWTPAEFIGLVHRDQGRWALRSLIAEHLVEQITEVGPCTAPQHREGQPYERVKNNMTENGVPNFAVMADVFDLILTGNCRACNEDALLPF